MDHVIVNFLFLIFLKKEIMTQVVKKTTTKPNRTTVGAPRQKQPHLNLFVWHSGLGLMLYSSQCYNKVPKQRGESIGKMFKF